MSTKRYLDGTEKAKTEVLFEQRFVIETPNAGVIIGKAGATIKGIRDDTGAFISILADDHGAKERVISVKGTVDAVGNAIGAVAAIVAQEQNATSTEVQLLIHKHFAGAIIGKAGAVIQEIMADTEARVGLAKEALPYCDEKVCKVTGTAEQITAAVRAVCQRMEDNPLRDTRATTPYVPGFQPAPAFPAFAAPGGYAQNPFANGGAFNPYAPPSNSTAPGSLITEKIVIPTVSAGGVIGKRGTVVREIKEQSGAASIGIAEADPAAPTDRLCTITGSAQAVQAAIYLIRQRVESQPATPAAPLPGLPPFGALSFGGQTQFGFGSAPPGPGPGPPPQMTEKIVIPTMCSGSVIGKGGSVVKEIKAQTGCTISIAEADTSNPEERVVTLSGSSLGVQNAIILIRQRVESYQPGTGAGK